MERNTTPKYPGYSIDITGKIFDAGTGREVNYRNVRNAKFAFVRLDGRGVLVEVARAVLHTFAPLASPVELDSNWRHEYLDGNKWNCSFENLRWVGAVEPISWKGDRDYFHVPGFSSFVISRAGCLINTVDSEEVKIGISEYLNVDIKSDSGDLTFSGIHRLLCLTFKPIFFNGNKMVVNHKDGDKHNYELNNLEWVTYKGNLEHAFETGLRPDNKPVLSKDILSGEVKYHYSMAECARYFSISPVTGWYHLHKRPGKVFAGHYLLKWESDDTPWPEYTRKDCFYVAHGKPNAVLIKDAETDEIIRVDSILKAAEFTGIKYGTVSYYLRNKIPRAKGGYYFKLDNENEEWPVGETRGRFFFKNGPPKRTKDYKVTNTLTGEIVTVTGSDEMSRVIGLEKRTISHHLRRSKCGTACKHFIIIKLKSE